MIIQQIVTQGYGDLTYPAARCGGGSNVCAVTVTYGRRRAKHYVDDSTRSRGVFSLFYSSSGLSSTALEELECARFAGRKHISTTLLTMEESYASFRLSAHCSRTASQGHCAYVRSRAQHGECYIELPRPQCLCEVTGATWGKLH